VSCRFVSEHAGWFPIQRLCELVDVPRSSFYEWSTRPLSEHYLDDAWLANGIRARSVSPSSRKGALRV
jgi:hypothetical protein